MSSVIAPYTGGSVQFWGLLLTRTLLRFGWK